MVRIKQCTFLHHCIGDMVWELGELQKQQKEAVSVKVEINNINKQWPYTCNRRVKFLNNRYNIYTL